MGRILLIEDSPDSQFLVRSAVEEMAEIIIAGNLESARHLLRANEFDLLIADVRLPDGESFELCAEIVTRERSIRPRVIFLTCLSDLADKLTAFASGCDDYVVKPIDPLELRARVQAQLRSCRDAILDANVVRAGNLQLDLSEHIAHLGTGIQPEQLELTPTEFKILKLLARHPGQAFSREQLLEAIKGGGGSRVTDRSVDTHICRVRKKLGSCTHSVEPIYGVGYRLAKKSA